MELEGGGEQGVCVSVCECVCLERGGAYVCEGEVCVFWCVSVEVGVGGGVEGKRVCACLHVCVEQRIGWGLGVRVCVDVRAYNVCMRQSERVHACVFEKVR